MHIPNSRFLIVGVLLLLLLMVPAQTQQRAEAFVIDAFPGQAKVVRSQGRLLVDVEDLARMTNGSLRFEGNRITLTLPLDVSTSAGHETPTAGFSPPS
jgi:hypothetical protein